MGQCHRPQRAMASRLWSRIGAGAAAGGGAQLYAGTGEHESTRQGDIGCERSSRWGPPRQPLAPKAASQPLRPPSDEQDGAVSCRQGTKTLKDKAGMVYRGGGKQFHRSCFNIATGHTQGALYLLASKAWK